MGNRAVIEFTTTGEHHPDNIGIYLHWHGSDVQKFLDEAQELMATRGPDECYAPARLLQVIANHIPGNMSLGLGKCAELDCDNWDNGTFLVHPGTLELLGTYRVYDTFKTVTH